MPQYSWIMFMLMSFVTRLKKSTTTWRQSSFAQKLIIRFKMLQVKTSPFPHDFHCSLKPLLVTLWFKSSWVQIYWFTEWGRDVISKDLKSSHQLGKHFTRVITMIHSFFCVFRVRSCSSQTAPTIFLFKITLWRHQLWRHHLDSLLPTFPGLVARLSLSGGY